jgi:hypothetical protein
MITPSNKKRSLGTPSGGYAEEDHDRWDFRPGLQPSGMYDAKTQGVALVWDSVAPLALGDLAPRLITQA